jgi:hypothetical protein
MKDLNPLHHFLGVSVELWSDDLFLHQHQCARDILKRTGMSDCKPWSTLVNTQAKVSSDMGAPVSDPTAYRSLVGALQYLTFTRPDIAYTVQQVCLHIHSGQPGVVLGEEVECGLRSKTEEQSRWGRSSSTEQSQSQSGSRLAAWINAGWRIATARRAFDWGRHEGEQIRWGGRAAKSQEVEGDL